MTGRALGDGDRKRLRLVRDSNRKRRSRLRRDCMMIDQKEILTERLGCHDDFIKVVVWLMMV